MLGEGIGKRGGNFRSTAGLYDLFGPERLCDTPISERGFVGLGGGAAMTGTRPVIDFMFADFVLDAVGEIVNQIAKMQFMSNGRLKMPILLRGCIGIGHSAATHHSGNHYPLYAHFPGLRVVVPSTPADAKGLLHHALRSDDPVLFLEHRELLSSKGPVPEGSYEIPFGKAAVVREGSDVTVVALALMVQRTAQACEQLTAEGISVELIDPRTVAPLDIETIARSVAKTGRLLIVDEAFGPYGIGARSPPRLPTPASTISMPRSAGSMAFTRPRLIARRWKPRSFLNFLTSFRPSATFWPSEICIMATPITIPRLGWNMDEGVFQGWIKQDGDTIALDDPLFTLEGEKATEEIASLALGILHILPGGPKPGDTIAVGTVIGHLLAEGEAALFVGKPAQVDKAQPALSIPVAAKDKSAPNRVEPSETMKKASALNSPPLARGGLGGLQNLNA